MAGSSFAFRCWRIFGETVVYFFYGEAVGSHGWSSWFWFKVFFFFFA